MTGTDLYVNKCKQSRSYLNHLVYTVDCILTIIIIATVSVWVPKMHYKHWLPWIYSLRAWRWLKRESKHVALNCILCNKLLVFDWYIILYMSSESVNIQRDAKKKIYMNFQKKHFGWCPCLIKRGSNKTGNVCVKEFFETLSYNQFYSGKVLSITHHEYMSVALVIQHALRMRHIDICGLPRSIVFSHITP